MEFYINAAKTILTKYNLADMLNGYTEQQIAGLIHTSIRPLWPTIDTYDKAKAYATDKYGAFALCMFHEADLEKLYSIATQLISAQAGK
jgi:hypothetical protein